MRPDVRKTRNRSTQTAAPPARRRRQIEGDLLAAIEALREAADALRIVADKLAPSTKAHSQPSSGTSGEKPPVEDVKRAKRLVSWFVLVLLLLLLGVGFASCTHSAQSKESKYETLGSLHVVCSKTNEIAGFFSGAYEWTAGFIEGFFGRLGWTHWTIARLFFKPFEDARDRVFFVVHLLAHFFHATHEQVVSIVPERKVVEKVVVHEYRHEHPPNSAAPPVPQQPQLIVRPLDTDAIRALIKESLDRYDADKAGQPNYALEPSGAELIGIGCTQVYEQRSRLQSMFGIPLYYANYGAWTVIQHKRPSITPGECFAYEGGHGQVVVKLSRTINVTAVSYEHLPVVLSPEGNLNTAPKEFLVWSYQEYHQKGVNKKHLLGKFTYDDQGAPLQTFYTQFPDPHFTSIIEFETESNHGAPLTCLYRVRVHGQPLHTC
ncbi:SUN domain-containing protein [Aphelenchoides fujianensis]|nr:SUN domain-containing protein [Aphelenchoides fujianensis]